MKPFSPMNLPLCNLRPALAVVAIAVCFSLSPRATAAETLSDPGLRLIGKIPVVGMTGTWDHLTADPDTTRIFANAQDIHTLEVIDLRESKVLKAVTGPFNRNQGAAYMKDLAKVAITNGRSGTVTFLNSTSLEPGKSVGIGLGADLMAYDPQTKTLFLDHGGRDSNRGFGAVAVIDAQKEELIADIPTDLRPAAMVVEPSGPRLFVCVPSANQIFVMDRGSRSVVARYDLTTAKKPVSITLDAVNRRLFVLARNPAQLVVMDMDSGKTVASLPTVGESEDIFYDGAHKRLFATGLEGVVYCYRQLGADSYALSGKVPVREHAGSSLLIPQLERFIVAVAQHDAQMPELWVFETLP